MHKLKRIYIILTYMFFIYPPFIAGLVLIYRDFGDNVEKISLIINLIVIAVLAIIISLAIRSKRIHFPSPSEIKYLLFGLAGNIVVYFYTFQNNLEIANIVTIYLVLLIVLGVHYLLISKKFQPLELWILLPIFLLYDYLFIWLSGCGYSSNYTCTPSAEYGLLLTILFLIIIAFVMLYYIYKIIQYRLFDFFKVINIILSIVLSIFAFDGFNAQEEFISTVAILIPFFIIVDFIVSIVNKTFKKQMVLFYIRTITLIILSIFVGTSDILRGEDIRIQILASFVVITYVSLFISILHSILKIETSHVKIHHLLKHDPLSPKCILSTEEDRERLKDSFARYQGEVTYHENDINLKVLVKENIIGFLHSSIEELPITSKTLQARVYYIDVVDKDITIINTLLQHLERLCKSKEVAHVTYVANIKEDELTTYLINSGYIPIEVSKEVLYLIKVL